MLVLLEITFTAMYFGTEADTKPLLTDDQNYFFDNKKLNDEKLLAQLKDHLQCIEHKFWKYDLELMQEMIDENKLKYRHVFEEERKQAVKKQAKLLEKIKQLLQSPDVQNYADFLQMVNHCVYNLQMSGINLCVNKKIILIKHWAID